MNCETFHDRLADFVSGELDSAQRAAVQKHLDACTTCRELARGLQAAAAVVETGVLSAEEAERRTAGLTLPAARRAQAPPRVSPVLRYAAAILIAFSGGYLTRGWRTGPTTNTLGPRPQPELVTRQFLDRYEKAANEYPGSSSFSRSLLMLASSDR